MVPPGTVDIYNPGVAAGRLYVVGVNGQTLDGATDQDIVVIESVPDELPPAAALITSDPQTPLAHVNLLARNRGIPNVSQAGVTSDPAIAQAARVRARVAMVAQDGQLELVVISQTEYQSWLDLQDSPERVSVPPVDVDAVPLAVSLNDLANTAVAESDISAWRPIIGGKSAGFLSLIQAGTTAPLEPQAITVAPYFAHLEQVGEELAAMLDDRSFSGSRETRFLYLEGPEDYAERFTSERDVERATTIIDEIDPNGPLARILDAGGFKKLFREQSVGSQTLSEIEALIETTYGDYAETQGIRFRSSSSVEDIEGFNGAGLYDSNTGFIDPFAQPEQDDQKKSIEFTIKKTWASYWSFEAFEERRLANIDHESGGMGVLVHARFDDPLEVNNGVATFAISPDTCLLYTSDAADE